jgi:hypothetical protein
MSKEGNNKQHNKNNDKSKTYTQNNEIIVNS